MVKIQAALSILNSSGAIKKIAELVVAALVVAALAVAALATALFESIIHV